MRELGEIKDAGGITPIDVADLEEDLRQGRLSERFELRYGPWTGEEFRRLRDIPELQDALNSQNACFAEQMRNPAFPWASTLLSAVVIVAGLINLWFLYPGQKSDTQIWLMSHYQTWITGFQALILDGSWWTPWSAQLVHAGPSHLLPNLAVLIYGGYRVERALGATAFLVTCASAVAVAGVLVGLWSDLPVMGSSILGYGFFGALLTIGFRYGDTIPRRYRGFYGYGNLLLFALLLVSGLRIENASHLGHLGGLLGGILAAMLVGPATSFRGKARVQRRRRNWVWVVVLSLAPLMWIPVVKLVPSLAFGGQERVQVERWGVEFALYERLKVVKEERSSILWRLPNGGYEIVFCGEQNALSSMEEEGKQFEEDWVFDDGREFPARRVKRPEVLGDGWSSHALEIQVPTGEWYRVVEHRFQRGRRVFRVGARLRIDADGVLSEQRRDFFLHFLKTIRFSDPEVVAKARQMWSRSPGLKTAYDLADRLKAYGMIEDLDTLLGEAVQLDSSGRRAARDWRRLAKMRLDLWMKDGLDLKNEDSLWVSTVLQRAPSDWGIQKAGILLFVKQEACEQAQTAYSKSQESQLTIELLSEQEREKLAACGEGNALRKD